MGTQIEITVSAMQKAAIKAAADKAGLSVSSWARSALVAAVTKQMKGDSE